ncbi:MAG: hypothetical protein ACW963_06480 [Candidatus Sifarchaeia archaeon]|jgi:hypothetical protein
MGLTTCISTAKEELNAANTKLQSGNQAEGALYLTNLFNTLEDCTKRAKLLGDEKEELIMRADILELLFNGLTLAAQFINKEEFNEFLQSEELKVSKIKKSFENSEFETGQLYLSNLMKQIFQLMPEVKSSLYIAQEKIAKGDLLEVLENKNPLPIFSDTLPCPHSFCNSLMDIDMFVARSKHGQYSLRIKKECYSCDFNESTIIRVPKRIIKDFYYEKRSSKTLIDLLS